jgi:hypothetical protein
VVVDIQHRNQLVVEVELQLQDKMVDLEHVLKVEVLEHQIILQEQLRVTQVVAVVEMEKDRQEMVDVVALVEVEQVEPLHVTLEQQEPLILEVVEVVLQDQDLVEQVVQVSLSQEQVQLQELLSQLVLDVQEVSLT